MERLIGTPSQTFWDKVKNNVFGFVFIMLWVQGVVALLNYLNTPVGQYMITPRLSFFFSCIMAPLWEEAVFRYGPITLIKSVSPKLVPVVVLVSSIIFGLGHGYGIASILLQGMMGLVFACVYLKNGSIWYAILLHSAWNIYCTVNP